MSVTMIVQAFASALLLSSLLALGPAVAASAQTLAIWSRKPGRHSDDGNPARHRLLKLDVTGLKTVRRTLDDAQYGRKETYRGLPLTTILKHYRGQPHDDGIILHFENGMSIPLPLGEDSALRQLRPFLALEVCPQTSSCSRDFPPVPKEEAYSVTADPRPITFAWNKLVVASPWHPDVPRERSSIFSPWRHADTLIGIEFVNLAAYQRQFELGEELGEQVFVQRCQFCHGARQVGATFGWDFVTPLALHEKRSPESLLNHVKYPKAMAQKMGLMMPPQKDVNEAEIQAVWRWMRRAAARELRPYQP